MMFIDCLSEIERDEEPIEFDSCEKLRRLISSFITRTQTSIVYTYRVNDTLFSTQYKREYHRPQCKNSKEWDGWASKSIMVDFVLKKKDMKPI
jgi:hypothetical protein